MRDKWRAKQWYTLIAPPTFDNKELGFTIGEKPEHVVGRISDVPLSDLTGNFKKMHVKLKFKVQEIRGNQAFTTYIGHELSNDYVRRLVRRRKSKIDHVFDVKILDGSTIKLKIMAVSDKRINSSVKHVLRLKMCQVVNEKLSQMNFSDCVRYVLDDVSVKDIRRELKDIYLLKKVDIWKSEILSQPEIKFKDVVLEDTEPKEEEKDIASTDKVDDATEDKKEKVKSDKKTTKAAKPKKSKDDAPTEKAKPKKTVDKKIKTESKTSSKSKKTEDVAEVKDSDQTKNADVANSD